MSVSVPGDTLTSVLPHLTPKTPYEVNVVAQYDQGDSFPVTGQETTLEGQSCSLIPLPSSSSLLSNAAF